MSLPIPFLSGLAILLVYDQLVAFLPGEVAFGQLLPYALLLPVPAVIAHLTGTRLRRVAVSGSRPSAGLRVALRLQGWAVPTVFGLLVFRGLANAIEQSFPSSMMNQLLALLSPLFLMEISQRAVERRTIHWLEWRGLEPQFVVPSGQLSMSVFLMVPIVLFAVLSEIALQERRAEVLFRATAVGATLGLLLVILVLCVALPLMFRWILPVESRLPSHLDGEVRDTATRLGFRRRGVVAMRTGHRIVNAALVGPLPWPRYLVLTDGILTILDRYSLRGVVAHEVGHAIAGHPGWLLLVFVVVPVLSIHPLGLLDYDAMDTALVTGLGGAGLLVAVLGLRAMSRRFEFEADQLSADALGGAAPCVNALRRVGDLFSHHRHRGTFRHPSEEQRVRNLMALETDAEYRDAFHRRGRRLRAVILIVLIAAVAVSSWTHAKTWPIDRAVYLTYSGDFRGARAALDELPAEPFGIAVEDLTELSEEVDTALALAGDGGDWQRIRDALADDAWRRGLEVLARDGPAAARPWLAWCLSRDAPTAVERTLYIYCAAAAREQDELRARTERHLRRLPAPPEVLARLQGETGTPGSSTSGR